RHAARLALLVCLAGGIAASIAVELLHRYAPSLGARLLPTSAVAALAASGLGWVAIQALTGYLRADREEPLLGYTALGVAVALVIAASAARFGAATTCLAYAAAVLIATVPLVGSGFWRARARHLAASPNGVHLP
ncbi:MAG: hypothetical protein JWN53_1686, partial [Gemmatimonadetes bacterium]|nr:hypothetical protein [Gemmatimonadota bacterium]